MRAGDADRVFEVNLGGTADRRRGARGRASSGSSTLPRSPRSARPRPAAAPTRRQPFTAGGLGIAYVNSKHEAEAEVLRVAAQGLDAVIVNPTFVLGPTIAGAARCDRAHTALPAAPDPRLRRRRPQHRRRPRRRRRASARRREGERRGERYILGGRNFTLQRLFADLSRICGVPAPPLRLPPRLAVGGAQLSERSACRSA